MMNALSNCILYPTSTLKGYLDEMTVNDEGNIKHFTHLSWVVLFYTFGIVCALIADEYKYLEKRLFILYLWWCVMAVPLCTCSAMKPV